MFNEINEIRKARKKYNGKMFTSGVRAFQDLEELEAGIFRDGSISGKNKELIALGISISQSCYG